MPDNPILAAAGVNANIRAAIPQVQSNVQQTQDALESQSEAARRIGQAETTISQEADLAVLAIEKANQSAAAAFGVNASAQGYVMNQLAAMALKSGDKMVQAKAKIDAKDQIKFQDDPMAWLAAQITINDDIREYNSAEKDRDDAVRQSQAINQSFQSQAATNALLKQSITQGSMDAKAQKIADEAELRATVFTIEGLKVGNQGIKDVLQLKQHELTNMFQVANLQLAQKGQEIALQRLAMDKEMFDWKMTEKEDEADAFEKFTVAVNKGMAMAGVPTEQFFDSSKAGNRELFRAIRSGKSPMDKRIYEYYMIGSQGVFGGTPAQALNAVTTTAPKLTPSAKTTADFLMETRAALPATMMAPGTPKEEQVRQQSQQYNAMVSAELASQQKNVTSGQNLYYPGSLKTIMENAAQAPDMARLMNNSRVFRDILVPAAKSGQEFNEPNQVVAVVQDALKSGKINFSEALDVVNLYQFGVSVNNKSRGFLQFGLPEQKTYNVKIGNPVGFGSQTVNMADPTSFARALMQNDKMQTPFLVRGDTLF